MRLTVIGSSHSSFGSEFVMFM